MLFYVLIQASIVVQNVFLKEDQENRQIFCQIDKKKKEKRNPQNEMNKNRLE